MRDILRKMQDISQTYVGLLAEILKVDVTIVDASLFRIAGSGKLVSQLGKDISKEGHIIRYALETKELQIVANPGKEGVCLTCDRRGKCKDIFEMWMPLLVEGEAIGVLGLVAFNQRQRTHIIKNQETFLQFLNQFAGLLTLKAQELMEKETNTTLIQMLERVVDRIEIGVLVFSRNGAVTRSNQGAKKILAISQSDIIHKTPSLEKTGNDVLGMTEYRMCWDKQEVLLVGDLYDLDIDPYAKLFVFNSADILRQNPLGVAALKRKTGVGRIISASTQSFELKQDLKRIAHSSSNVLISGEVGVGKKLYASALHEESERCEFPFSIVNCEYTTDEQLEAELWGREKSGSGKGQVGTLESVGQGTLFLNEVGGLSLSMQKKLLAVLENGCFTRFGGTRRMLVRFRVIASTRNHLAQLVEEGHFIRGLYYKLSVLPLEIAPLRERKADIRVLAMMYLNFFQRQLGKEILGIKPDFWQMLEQHPWPGNVSELRNNMEYVVNVLAYPNVVTAELLQNKLEMPQLEDGEKDFNLSNMERQYIQEALALYGHSVNGKKIVAQKLGLSSATLYRKIEKYRIKT